MKVAGFLLLLAGWAIVVVALVILPSPVSRCVFVVAGLLVEALGLVLAARGYSQLMGEQE